MVGAGGGTLESNRVGLRDWSALIGGPRVLSIVWKWRILLLLRRAVVRAFPGAERLAPRLFPIAPRDFFFFPHAGHRCGGLPRRRGGGACSLRPWRTFSASASHRTRIAFRVLPGRRALVSASARSPCRDESGVLRDVLHSSDSPPRSSRGHGVLHPAASGDFGRRVGQVSV